MIASTPLVLLVVPSLYTILGHFGLTSVQEVEPAQLIDESKPAAAS